MVEGHGDLPTIVVVSTNDAATLTDCLDGVAEQGVSTGVVAVDVDSSDGSIDVAIHHPVVSRAVAVASGDLDRLLDAVTMDAPTHVVLVLPGDKRPGDGWLDAAMEGLAHHGLVHGPEGHPRNLGIDRRRTGVVSLATHDLEELTYRVLAAGSSVGMVEGMRIGPARSLAPGTALPPTPPPDAGVARYQGLVSVVVCTRNRPDHLRRCLASLDRLEDLDYELIVIDNNDRPSVDHQLVPVGGRVVHESRRGLDPARNRGLAEADGDVIAYVDDDCEVDPHWITGLRAGFADPEVGAVTGRVRAASLDAPSHRWFESHFSFDRGLRRQRFTRWDRRSWYPMWAGAIGAGCNMAFRRDDLLEIGGFDELLDMGSRIGGGGDLDVFARTLDRGVLIDYRPDALVWHHHRATPSDVRRQFLGYGVAVGALLAKSVLDRPGTRFLAVRFFLERLRIGVRLVRERRAGLHVLPVHLVMLDLVGQCAGPFVYLGARLRARTPRG